MVSLEIIGPFYEFVLLVSVVVCVFIDWFRFCDFKIKKDKTKFYIECFEESRFIYGLTCTGEYRAKEFIMNELSHHQRQSIEIVFNKQDFYADIKLVYREIERESK